jgi:hypothetical protein
MRTGALRAMFALAAISMVCQIATGIHLVEVRFNSGTRLNGVDLNKCATDLKSRSTKDRSGRILYWNE